MSMSMRLSLGIRIGMGKTSLCFSKTNRYRINTNIHYYVILDYIIVYRHL